MMEYYAEEEEEDYEEEEVVGGNGGRERMGEDMGKKMRRYEDEGYGYGGNGGKGGFSGALEKKSDGRSRNDSDADSNQLMQLEEKDVVSSVPLSPSPRRHSLANKPSEFRHLQTHIFTAPSQGPTCKFSCFRVCFLSLLLVV